MTVELGEMNQAILEKTKTILRTFFEARKMPVSHGINHCTIVLNHMQEALKASELNLSKDRCLTLCLAALLHEADDHKYFPEGSKNATNILNQVLEERSDKAEIIDDVEEMISYVSASANGNSVPKKAEVDPTYLWPRFCDRLESIGTIGAVRCLQYNQEKGDPLFTETTPRPKTEEEVWAEVKEERWLQYQKGGNSASMMDHYFDKLLQIAVFKPDVVQNKYLEAEAKKRVEPLVKICVEYGRTGEPPIQLIQSYDVAKN
eukprot:TRINITY_DN19964_c0_g1_i1.p1 TRINITY_DN19964_c0_g1~~TRINITY_DN19964_c0_g1_i1.p1  ORF type:complete len:277 (-),score=35.44 TRINITY_DN19964_c0_g1_i1:306-1088(-)